MKAQDLKKSILQYAMQGKLVAQDPSDEPASELLKRIKAEKEQLIKDGKIKKEKPLPPITQDEIPYDLSQGWEWVRLGDICNIYTGNSINETEKKLKYTNLNDGFNYIGTKDINYNNTITYNNGIKIPFNNDGFRLAPAGSVLMCVEGGSAGRKIAITKEEICFGNKLACFSLFYNNSNIIFYLLQSPIFTNIFKDKLSGIIGGVSIVKLKNIIAPLPPLAEQKRIVEKLEEILPLVDEYGKNEEILSEMNQKLPKQIRQSILQYAVQGKLVEQNPQDEPASELLKRIKAEKDQLIKEGKIKKEKPLPPITQDEIPYDLPQGWQWVRLGEIAQIYRGLGPKYELNSNYKFINQKCIKWGSIENQFCKTVSKESFERFSNDKLIKIYDLLINSTGEGTIGRCSTASQNIVGLGYDSHVLLIRPILCLNSYYQILLNSNIGQNQINEAKGAKTTKQTELGVEKTRTILIPLPPLAEQMRIVAKVEELMKFVDMLS